jgi:asparagine synthase (glutamine-hydrolysing)
MATSLEVRVLILDRLFVEWATGLPRRGNNAWGNRNTFSAGGGARCVPQQALYRPKQGFALPLVHWIRNELRDLIMTVLLEPRTLERGYFNPEGVRRLLDEHFRKHRDHFGGIWRLLIFELWHRNLLERIRATDWGAEPYRVTSAAGDLAGNLG